MGFSEQFNALHDLASSALGLDDFGSNDYQQPMQLLLESLDKYSRFNAVGVQSITGELVGMLVGRLLVQKAMLDKPVIDTPVVGPLVILGMTRTGSTVLHRLIAQDLGLQTLPLWLASMPVPRPPEAAWPQHSFFQATENALNQIDQLNPEFRKIHPMDAGKPDECRFALNQTFWAPTFFATSCVPEYFDWLVEGDSEYAYRYYRNLLSIVGEGDNRPWLLKDPSHMLGLDGLLNVFPNACIVQTHRDPLECIGSVTNLVKQVREVREENLSLEAQKEQAYNTWPVALKKMEITRRKYNPKQFYDVHITEVRNRPLETLESIYNYFNLPITESARQAWQSQITEDPNAGHTTKHKPVDFGFERSVLTELLGEYNERYQQVEQAL